MASPTSAEMEQRAGLSSRRLSNFIIDPSPLRWMCHAFMALKESGERLSHAVGCAFAICLERKQRRDKECSVEMQFCNQENTFTRLSPNLLLLVRSTFFQVWILQAGKYIGEIGRPAGFQTGRQCRPRPQGSDPESKCNRSSPRLRPDVCAASEF